MVLLDDLDGDGTQDFLVSSDFEISRPARLGSVSAYSGATLTKIYTVVDPQAEIGDGFGESLCAIGDITGDGFADFVVGAPESMDRRGFAAVYSGRDGELLRVIEGDSVFPLQGVGAFLLAAGDLTSDGVPDFFINGSRSGLLAFRLISGAGIEEASLLIEGGRGAPLGILPDVDGDGVPEVLLDRLKAHGSVTHVGLVVSGATGKTIRSLEWGEEAGSQVSRGAAIDLDADGRIDVLRALRFDAGASSTESHLVRLVGFSGADGEVLQDSVIDMGSYDVVHAMSSLGDLAGDDRPDLYLASSKFKARENCKLLLLDDIGGTAFKEIHSGDLEFGEYLFKTTASFGTHALVIRPVAGLSSGWLLVSDHDASLRHGESRTVLRTACGAVYAFPLPGREAK